MKLGGDPGREAVARLKGHVDVYAWHGRNGQVVWTARKWPRENHGQWNLLVRLHRERVRAWWRAQALVSEPVRAAMREMVRGSTWRWADLWLHQAWRRLRVRRVRGR
jgi:hypothetical protein